MDDEYFRLVTAFEETAGDHPDAVLLSNAVVRSLQKPQKLGFARAFRESQRIFEQHTASGLYVGKADAYEVDLERVHRVISRVTRGLFLSCVDRRLQLSTRVVAYSMKGYHPEPEAHRKLTLMMNACGPWKCLGESTFCWKYVVMADQPESSFWAFLVYGSVGFFSFSIGQSPESEEQSKDVG